MIRELQKIAETDSELKNRLEKVREYAEVYVFAKKRQKGCDGLGEMTNLQDEFKNALDNTRWITWLSIAAKKAILVIIFPVI